MTCSCRCPAVCAGSGASLLFPTFSSAPPCPASLSQCREQQQLYFSTSTHMSTTDSRSCPQADPDAPHTTRRVPGPRHTIPITRSPHGPPSQSTPSSTHTATRPDPATVPPPTPTSTIIYGGTATSYPTHHSGPWHPPGELSRSAKTTTPPTPAYPDHTGKDHTTRIATGTLGQTVRPPLCRRHGF